MKDGSVSCGESASLSLKIQLDWADLDVCKKITALEETVRGQSVEQKSGCRVELTAGLVVLVAPDLLGTTPTASPTTVLWGSSWLTITTSVATRRVVGLSLFIEEALVCVHERNRPLVGASGEIGPKV
jgi:hypothetical protein